MLNVDKKWVHPLPMNEKVVLPDTGGVTVTLIEANHCKQSVHLMSVLSLILSIFFRPRLVFVLFRGEADGECG
jgi:hypothetical protein